MTGDIDWEEVDDLIEDQDFEHQHRDVRVIRLPCNRHIYVMRPPEHNPNCAEEHYEECDCGFYAKQGTYELKYRHPEAHKLPVARLLPKL